MMSKTKKTLIAVLALTAFAGMTACDNNGTSEGKSETTTVTETTESPETTAETTKATTETTTEITTEATEVQIEETLDFGYKEAYKKLIEDEGYNADDTITYDLIYLNEDNIPELTLGTSGSWVSVYTYSEGEIHKIIDQWHCGVSGIGGYTYSPYNNSVSVIDADSAGAIIKNTYMSMNDNFELDVVNEYTSYRFNDANGNHIMDFDEELLDTPILYINGRKATEEEVDEKNKNKNKYKDISGYLTYDEFSLMLE